MGSVISSQDIVFNRMKKAGLGGRSGGSGSGSGSGSKHGKTYSTVHPNIDCNDTKKTPIYTPDGSICWFIINRTRMEYLNLNEYLFEKIMEHSTRTQSYVHLSSYRLNTTSAFKPYYPGVGGVGGVGGVTAPDPPSKRDFPSSVFRLPPAPRRDCDIDTIAISNGWEQRSDNWPAGRSPKLFLARNAYIPRHSVQLTSSLRVNSRV
jgi:hypothetical protein